MSKRRYNTNPLGSFTKKWIRKFVKAETDAQFGTYHYSCHPKLLSYGRIVIADEDCRFYFGLLEHLKNSEEIDGEEVVVTKSFIIRKPRGQDPTLTIMDDVRAANPIVNIFDG